MNDGAWPVFDPAQFINAFSDKHHSKLLGLRYDRHGDDWVELSMPYADHLVGDPETGILASGPILAMMDMAASVSVWVKGGHFRTQATLDLRVDYLRPATPGKTVTGRGECYRLTRSIAFVRGQAHDGDPDNPVAHVVGTYMFTDGFK